MNLPPAPNYINFASGSFVHRHEYEDLRRFAEVVNHELESRVRWIAEMCKILGYDNSDGFHSEPEPFTIAKRLVEINRTTP